MVRAAALALALAAGSTEVGSVAEELGASAYVFGYCEAYMPKQDADDILRSLADLNRDGVRDEADKQIGAVLLENYAQGRLEAAKLPLDLAACTKFIRRQSDRLEAARAKAAPR